MKNFELSLVESEAKLLLEAVAELERKWLAICDSSTDDDEIADYGNDLIELRLLKARFEQEAQAKFGPHVLCFSRALIK